MAVVALSKRVVERHSAGEDVQSHNGPVVLARTTDELTLALRQHLRFEIKRQCLSYRCGRSGRSPLSFLRGSTSTHCERHQHDPKMARSDQLRTNSKCDQMMQQAS